MKRPVLIVIFLFIINLNHAQDTLTVMQYNLLYYGVNTDFCTAENNSLTVKDPALRTILHEIIPDIFTVVEISSYAPRHQHLLDSVLNGMDLKSYEKSNFQQSTVSNTCSMLFYNREKLRMARQAIVQNATRDILIYTLYYQSDDLAQGDTAFVSCIVGHLKAGNTGDDEADRSVMVSNTMLYLADHQYHNQNMLFMGDFNFYTAFEPGFQTMTNYSQPDLRFYDPVNRIGSWNNNSSYKDLHTQSTHTSSDGCASSGGMDDRFDFILASNEIIDGSNHFRYLPGTYHAFGQDGNRFNGTINGSPANSTVSQQVADALYDMSDHLPVVMQLRVDKTLGFAEDREIQTRFFVSPNPVLARNGKLNIRFSEAISDEYLIEWFDLQGKVLLTMSFSPSPGRFSVDIRLPNLKAGVYLLKISHENTLPVCKKIVVKNG